MTNSSRQMTIFIERLARLPVATHPGLLFNPGVEGYRDHTFGGRAGPMESPLNVFHEMAHACQFGATEFAKRASPEGFLFKTKRIFVYNRYCIEPATSQAVERELDTFAYQLHLMRKVGYKVTDSQFLQDSAKLMQHMPDWYLVPGSSKELRMAWCVKLIEEKYAALTQAEVLDRLEAWLDKTWARLRRKATRRPYHAVAERYTGTGVLFQSQP